MNIVVREFEPESDSGFIFSTLPKSVYYGSHIKIPVSRANFFDTCYAYVQNVIADPKTRICIACVGDARDTIMGYSIVHSTCLEFVYVKEVFRGQGIAKLLLKRIPIFEINEFNLTKVGFEIMKKHKDLFKKELINEFDTRETNQVGHSSL